MHRDSMSTVKRWIEAYSGHPRFDYTSVLPLRDDLRCAVDSETRNCRCEGGPVASKLLGRSGLLSDFKLHWTLSFVLHHDGP